MSNFHIQLINQFFEISHKIEERKEVSLFERNFARIKTIFEEEGYIIQDPTNENYNDARTDCEANFVGKVSTKMVIKKTIKPIIYKKLDNTLTLVQKAVVFVESK